jgi:hypothetical protein
VLSRVNVVTQGTSKGLASGATELPKRLPFCFTDLSYFTVFMLPKRDGSLIGRCQWENVQADMPRAWYTAHTRHLPLGRLWHLNQMDLPQILLQQERKRLIACYSDQKLPKNM